MSQEVKKGRSQRVTITQKELYLSFLENSALIRLKKPSDASVQCIWDELTGKLNGVKGPIKSKEEWKKVFDNWRYMTVRRKRLIVADISQTGGGPANEGKLTELEERALACWGNILHEGIALPVAGFGNVVPANELIQEVSDNLFIQPAEVEYEDEQQQQRSNEEPAQANVTPRPERRNRKWRRENCRNIEDDDFMRKWKEDSAKKQKSFDDIDDKVGKMLDVMTNIASSLASIANSMEKLVEKKIRNKAQ